MFSERLQSTSHRQPTSKYEKGISKGKSGSINPAKRALRRTHGPYARNEGPLQEAHHMKKHFIISSMLALAMGIAQAQTQQSPAPMQGGTTDPRQGSQRQTEVSPAAVQGMGTGSVDQAAAQSFKGCLNGAPGSWTLTSDKGKTATVSGADNQLSPYQGQEVRIHGVQSTDGSITVSSIDKVSEACANQAASNSTAQSSSTNQNDINSQSTTSTSNSTNTATQPSSSAAMSNQSATPATPDNSTAMSGQSSATSSSTAPGATTPPVSNQTPSDTVGSGQTAQPAGQTPSTSTNDQNTASSTNSSDQNSTANQNATSSGQNQGVRQYSDMDQNAGAGGNKLPQTASPLPLLGFLGLGSLAAGLMGRRKK
jgi:hypothetical protein